MNTNCITWQMTFCRFLSNFLQFLVRVRVSVGLRAVGLTSFSFFGITWPLEKIRSSILSSFFEFSKPGARIRLGSGNKIAFWKNFRVFLRILNKRSSSNCYCLTPWGKVKLISKSRTPPNPERHFWKLWKKYFPLEIQLAGLRARSV